LRPIKAGFNILALFFAQKLNILFLRKTPTNEIHNISNSEEKPKTSNIQASAHEEMIEKNQKIAS